MKLVAMVVFSTLLAISPAIGQDTGSHDDRPKITVGGEAVVNVRPDKIVIALGIETSDSQVVIAKQKNNEILKKALAAIRHSGVGEQDIQTDHLSLQPHWDYDKRGNVQRYIVRNTLAVTVSDPAKVEDLIAAALAAGVSHIHGVEFQTTQLQAHRDKARELALRAAREKAERMAGALGETVGRPIQINENVHGYPWSYWSSWHGWSWGRSSGMSQVNVQVDSGESAAVMESIAMGKLAVRASVTVVFELAR